MTFEKRTAAIALGAVLVAPTAAWAFTGVGGCSGLPEYYRALGTLQGNMESACNMTVDQARHILAGYGGVPGVQPAVPLRGVSHRHHASAR